MSVRLQYAPQLVPKDDWPETTAANALKWVLEKQNFEDVMNNGKRVFGIVTAAEAQCRQEGTPPVTLMQTFSAAEDACLEEIAKAAKISKPMAHKVVFVRYSEIQFPPKVADKEGFFPPDPELEAKLFAVTSSIGINFDAYDNIPIEVIGKDPPNGLVDFSSIDLHPVLMNNIKLARYTKPTPVQKHALPIVLSGRDFMGCAQVSLSSSDYR